MAGKREEKRWTGREKIDGTQAEQQEEIEMICPTESFHDFRILITIFFVGLLILFLKL